MRCSLNGQRLGCPGWLSAKHHTAADALDNVFLATDKARVWRGMCPGDMVELKTSVQIRHTHRATAESTPIAMPAIAPSLSIPPAVLTLYAPKRKPSLLLGLSPYDPRAVSRFQTSAAPTKNSPASASPFQGQEMSGLERRSSRAH